MHPSGITLYVDVDFAKGDAPKSLDDWQLDIVRTLEEKYKLDDIRLVPDKHELAYGRWKAAIAVACKYNVPPPGSYIVRGVGESEVKQAFVEGLAPFCSTVIRGSR